MGIAGRPRWSGKAGESLREATGGPGDHRGAYHGPYRRTAYRGRLDHVHGETYLLFLYQKKRGYIRYIWYRGVLTRLTYNETPGTRLAGARYGNRPGPVHTPLPPEPDLNGISGQT